jgi:hypothetical protein
MIEGTHKLFTVRNEEAFVPSQGAPTFHTTDPGADNVIPHSIAFPYNVCEDMLLLLLSSDRLTFSHPKSVNGEGSKECRSPSASRKFLGCSLVQGKT